MEFSLNARRINFYKTFLDPMIVSTRWVRKSVADIKNSVTKYRTEGKDSKVAGLATVQVSNASVYAYFQKVKSICIFHAAPAAFRDA